MKKSYIAIIIAAALIGLFAIFVYSSGYEYGKSYKITLDDKGFHLIEDESYENGRSGRDGETVQNEEKDLDDFENINIKADICEVNVVPSDKNCIKINNNVKGSAITYKVEGNTLSVNQNVKSDFINLVTGKASVSVTICYNKTKEYGKLTIDNDKGNTVINEIRCDEIDVSNDLGNVELNNVTAKNVSGEMDAGDISFNSCTIDDVDLENDLGNIRANSVNFTESFKAESDSGNIDFSGKLLGRCDVSCDLGNITMHIDGKKEDYNIDAKAGLGNLKINGNDSGNRINSGSGSNSLKAQCDTGNITFNFSGQ